MEVGKWESTQKGKNLVETQITQARVMKEQ